MELGNIIFGNSRGSFQFPDRNLVNCDEWQKLIEFCCENCYGYARTGIPKATSGGVSTKTFEINPYYWGECTCGADWEDKPHLDDCLLKKHNFIYKPTGFWIDWYKYPFRDSYMSEEKTPEELKSIWTECYKSIFPKKLIRIIVAGSRNFTNENLLIGVLTDHIRIMAESHNLKKSNFEIVSGMAQGADAFGARFATKYDFKLAKFPAEWYIYGKSAGYIRNKEMAEYAIADGCQGYLYAFWDGESKGTKMMIDIAKELGLQVHVNYFKGDTQ